MRGQSAVNGHGEPVGCDAANIDTWIELDAAHAHSDYPRVLLEHDTADDGRYWAVKLQLRPTDGRFGSNHWDMEFGDYDEGEITIELKYLNGLRLLANLFTVLADSADAAFSQSAVSVEEVQ